MKLVRKYGSGNLTTYVYEDETIHDQAAAIGRIAAMAGCEDFAPGYIALRDLQHSAGEGSESCQLPPDAAPEEIRRSLAEHPCGKLYLSGRFEGARAGIGIDLQHFELFITLADADEGRMARLLQLTAGR